MGRLGETFVLLKRRKVGGQAWNVRRWLYSEDGRLLGMQACCDVLFLTFDRLIANLQLSFLWLMQLRIRWRPSFIMGRKTI